MGMWVIGRGKEERGVGKKYSLRNRRWQVVASFGGVRKVQP